MEENTRSSKIYQENFFKYMRQHHNLDRLSDYSTEVISDTTEVVNPQYRELDGEIRKAVGTLGGKRREFGAIMLNDPIEPDVVEAYQQKKARLQEEIAGLEKMVEDHKACRKATPIDAVLSKAIWQGLQLSHSSPPHIQKFILHGVTIER